MTWRFDQQAHKVYLRNPLDSTNVELRFHPILKVESDAPPSEFQDKIRSRFPLYQEERIQAVSMVRPGEIAVRDDRQHQFLNTEGNQIVTLGKESVRVSDTEHQRKDTLVENITLVTEALADSYGEVNATRLGVRYINIIDRDQIAKELGVQNIEWEELVDKNYLNFPHDMLDLSKTNSVAEIRSDVDGAEGMLTLKYGLIQNSSSAPDQFKFDIDRYINLEGDYSDIASYTEKFTLDIFSLFSTVIGEKLADWMEKEAVDTA